MAEKKKTSQTKRQKNTEKTSSTTTSKKSSTKKITQKKNTISTNFKIDSYIFYPNEGLGKIIAIEERVFENKPTPYYVIQFKSQKMISKVPIKNVKMLGIRKIVSKNSAKKIILSLQTASIETSLTWKDRLIKHQEIIKKGSVLETSEMLVTLYARAKERPLSFQEKQFYEFALESLSDELGVAMNLDTLEMTKVIKQHLESNISRVMENQADQDNS